MAAANAWDALDSTRVDDPDGAGCAMAPASSLVADFLWPRPMTHIPGLGGTVPYDLTPKRPHFAPRAKAVIHSVPGGRAQPDGSARPEAEARSVRRQVAPACST